MQQQQCQAFCPLWASLQGKEGRVVIPLLQLQPQLLSGAGAGAGALWQQQGWQQKQPLLVVVELPVLLWPHPQPFEEEFPEHPPAHPVPQH
ncbi:MAG: hypothetical protein RR320_01740 [Oscillospiraceae bacterium]